MIPLFQSIFEQQLKFQEQQSKAFMEMIGERDQKLQEHFQVCLANKEQQIRQLESQIASKDQAMQSMLASIENIS